MKKYIWKRLLSLALALVLVAGMLPHIAVKAEAIQMDAEDYRVSAQVKSCPSNINSVDECSARLAWKQSSSSWNVYIMVHVRSSGNPALQFQIIDNGTVDFQDSSCTSAVNHIQEVSAQGYTFVVTVTRAARPHSGGNCTTATNCTVCGTSYIDPNAQSWGPWTYVDGTTHSRVCTLDPAHTESGDHTGGTATCVAPATCGTCNGEYGDIAPDNHAYQWHIEEVEGVWQHWQVCSRDESHMTERGTCDGTATCVAPARCGTCGLEHGTKLDHVYHYAVEGDTITETCSLGCNHKAIASLIPNTLTYNGGEQTGLTVSNPGWVGTAPVVSATAIHAGTHTGTMTYAQAEGDPLSVSKEFTIAPYNISGEGVTVELNPATATYTGQAQQPAYTVKFNGTAMVEETDYTAAWSAGDFTTAGDYQLVVEGKAGGNFTGTRSAVYSIGKAQPTVTAPTEKTGLIYTGQPLALINPGSASHGDMGYCMTEDGTYGDIPTAVDAGTYKVWYRAIVEESDPNYISSTPAYVEVTIGMAQPSVTAPRAKDDLVYDGTAKELITAGSSEHGSFQYSLTGNEGEWSSSIPTATDAGDHTVYWKLLGDSNHSDAAGSVSVNIARAALPTAAAFHYTEPTLTYDGQEKTVTVTTDLPGVRPEHITVNYSAIPKNAGDYTFTVSVAQSDNYEASAEPLTNENWKFTIGKAQPTIHWDTTEFSFNTQPQGEARVALLNEEAFSGAITYTHKKAGAEAAEGLPTDAGTYQVTAAIEAQPNYKAFSAETTIVIQPKEITPTVELTPDVFYYDGQPKEPAVKVMDGTTVISDREYTVEYGANTGVGAANARVRNNTNGNYTITDNTEHVFLILPSIDALEGITPGNVNSSHQDAIDEMQAAMAGKDITGASEEAQKQWNDLLDRCEEMEEVIADAAAKCEEITAGTAALPQQPKTSDLDAIEALLDTYESIEGNLTEEEKTALEAEIEKLEDLKAAITEANTDLKEITDGTGALNKDDLDFADKAAIADLQKKIDSLESNPYLTDAQKQTLAEAEEKLAELEGEFAEADKVTKQLNQLPTAVKPDSKTAVEAYEAARKAYEDLDKDKAKVDPAAVKKLETLKDELTDYKITKGSGTKWVKGSSDSLTFTANGYFPHFKGVKMDGKWIDSSNYTAKSGSTIVTLKASYLQKLKTGSHTMDICFGDGDFTGEASCTFKVVTYSSSPITGDSSNMLLWDGMGMTSLLCLAMVVLFLSRKKGKQER